MGGAKRPSSGKRRKAPKDAQLLIRIAGQERDDFVRLCEELDTSAARELRRFIRAFIARHAQARPGSGSGGEEER